MDSAISIPHAPRLPVRNVFDQYGQPENRLSHALATCLHEDRAFLREFLAWAGAPARMGKSEVRVVEQRMPFTLADDLVERRGLPDIWVYDEDGWCLVVESKIAAPIALDQLRRHVRTAERAGFANPAGLTLTVDTPTLDLPPCWTKRRWRDLYALVQRRARGSWPARLSEFMEVCETRLPEDQYMKSGTLTTFDGIHFDEEHPYTPLQAKRLLGLLMVELRQRKDLVQLGMNPEGKGRPAITGGTHTWDLLPLRGARAEDIFTSYPHLDVVIHAECVGVVITLPHGVRREVLTHLKGIGLERFTSVLSEVASRMTAALAGVEGARPTMYVQQRHYRTQKSKPTMDALLDFDLRTLAQGGGGGVKYQPEWVEAAYQVITSKRSNIELAIGANLPLTSSVVRSRGAIDAVAETWIACEPWLREGLGVR